MSSRLFKTIIIALVSAASLSSSVYAQADIDKKMDEVKLNENMVFGEDFNEDKDIAYNKALLDLLNYMNERRAEKGCGALGVSDIQPVAQELKSFSNNRYNVLLYMPLSQVLALTARSHSEQMSLPAPSSSSGNAVAGTAHVPAVPSTPTTIPAPMPDDVLETLCNQDNWTEIKGFLSSFKKRGLINETGVSTSAAEVPGDAYTILIDDMYGILSILSPKNSPNRINCRTNKPDSETNYSNCKVIVWYR